MRTWMLALMLVAPAAAAKPWNGIEPGVSTRAEVTEKFGEPSKVVNAKDGMLVAYLKDKAIRGTTQAQFRVDAKTGVVQRIDVFPAPKIDRAAIEQTYGPACSGRGDQTSCYLLKRTPDQRVYFLYQRLGLVIFFAPGGNIVQSFLFQPGKP